MGLPVQTEIGEDKADERAQHNAAGEPEVEVVELGRFVFGINGRHQRIAHRLYHAVAQSNHQGGKEEAHVAIGKDGQQDTAQMHHERQVHQGFHAQTVDQHAADHHGDGKAPEGRRRNRTYLAVRQGKMALQII